MDTSKLTNIDELIRKYACDPDYISPDVQHVVMVKDLKDYIFNKKNEMTFEYFLLRYSCKPDILKGTHQQVIDVNVLNEYL